jgi:beta-lactamase superfamily II metal-dependent hydrolase
MIRTPSGLAALALLLAACGGTTEAGDDAATDVQDDADAPETVAPGLLRVVFFDVETSDAILVQAPSGRTLLIDLGVPQVVDSGHEADAARRVVARIEAFTGRRRVDYFLASHYHSDHVGLFRSSGAPVGGIAWAVDSLGLEVGTFLDRGRNPEGNSPTQIDYLRWAENRRNRRVIDAPGTQWIDLGPEVEVEVVAAPGAGIAPAGSDENGLSIPLRITFGDLEIASAGDLTGDCSDMVDVETAVAPLMGRVEVYKVSHHGSQTSSNLTWIETLRPLASVFPAGVSRFGYPHERTVRALGAVGDLHYTRDGDVVLESPDGRSFAIGGIRYTARTEAEEEDLPPFAYGVDEKSDALCRNGRDDDRDGYTDCADWSCSRCPGVTACP